MQRGRPRFRRPATNARAALLAVTLAVAAAAGVSTTAIASGTEATTSAEETVTFVLAPRDAAEVTTLATARDLSPGTRASRLAAAMPTAGTRSRVVTVVRGAGLHVVHQNRWSLSAVGSAAQLRALLGTPIGATVPAALRGLVTTVVADTNGHHVHPLSVPNPQTGRSLNTLYQGVNGTPKHGIPLTIATIQFSGWNTGDLTTYAAGLGRNDPLASGQYTSVSVDGADPTATDGNGGEVEVALDQESLLAVAPAANQRAYFAPNSSQGYIDAITQVASDAAVADNHIVALSVSWGQCETAWLNSFPSPTADLEAMHAAITSLLATGVTMFASTGDFGTYDCNSSQTGDVDYPASDPLVVGVGGTRVHTDNSQTAWDNGVDSTRTAFNGAAGGGYSFVWPLPSYQQHLTSPAAKAQSGSSKFRMVPDIAAEADPYSGVVVVTGGQPKQFGGTSLAAPISAGLFTNSLANQGWTAGIGDIHASLYAAAGTGFTDITASTPLPSGLDPEAYPATVGYDLVTGLGTPLWTRLRNSYDGPPVVTIATSSPTTAVHFTAAPPAGMTYTKWMLGTGAAPVVDATTVCDTTGFQNTPPSSFTAAGNGPVAFWVEAVTGKGRCYVTSVATVVETTARLSVTSPVQLQATAITAGIRLRWTTTTGTFPIVRNEYRVASLAADWSHPPATYRLPVSVGLATTVAVPLEPGTSACVEVRAVDQFGVATAWSPPRCVLVPFDDRSLVGTGWSRSPAPGWLAGTSTVTTTAGRSLTSPAMRVRQIGLLATRCTSCGSVDVYVGTTRVGTVSLAGPNSSRVVVMLPRLAAARYGAVRLVTTSNRYVRIDGLVVTGY